MAYTSNQIRQNLLLSKIGPHALILAHHFKLYKSSRKPSSEIISVEWFLG